MQEIINYQYNGGVVDIDGKAFRNCTFNDLTIYYNGGDGPSFIGCTFNRCRLGLGGAAEQTVKYLAVMYKGFPDWAGPATEILFDQIRGSAARR